MLNKHLVEERVDPSFISSVKRLFLDFVKGERDLKTPANGVELDTELELLVLGAISRISI